MGASKLEQLSKMPLQTKYPFVPKPPVIPTVAKPTKVVAEEHFNGPIVGEVIWTRRDGTLSSDPPAPPKLDPAVPRPPWTPEDPKWIPKPRARMNAYRANLASVKRGRPKISVGAGR